MATIDVQAQDGDSQVFYMEEPPVGNKFYSLTFRQLGFDVQVKFAPELKDHIFINVREDQDKVVIELYDDGRDIPVEIVRRKERIT